MNRKYNKGRADTLLKEYIELTGMDLESKSRKPEVVYVRSLFYKVLTDINLMGETTIERYLESKGVTRDRSSIWQALRKMESYYLNYSEFRELYDTYFNDRKDGFLNKEKSKIDKAERRNEIIRLSKKDYIELQNFRTKEITHKDNLDRIIEKIPLDKRGDIYEMVNLRVKSWDWKSKNEYEIIHGY
tara:strand:+ start:259 stop:819 length:561 start_codon:yes stop_codon:yes gene_type:complete